MSRHTLGGDGGGSLRPRRRFLAEWRGVGRTYQETFSQGWTEISHGADTADDFPGINRFFDVRRADPAGQCRP